MFFRGVQDPDFRTRVRQDSAHFEQTGLDPVSSEISDLLLFFSYFASQNKEIKSGNYFFDVSCAN